MKLKEKLCLMIKAEVKIQEAAKWHFDKSLICTSIAKMKRHTDYQAAKDGDLNAAIRLVSDMISREKLETIKTNFPKAIPSLYFFLFLNW